VAPTGGELTSDALMRERRDGVKIAPRMWRGFIGSDCRDRIR